MKFPSKSHLSKLKLRFGRLEMVCLKYIDAKFGNREEVYKQCYNL